MSPQEHYRRAEELLAEAEELVTFEHASTLAQIAQGHALLAQIGSPLSWQTGRPATLGRPQ